ncbi:MAG: tyrosine-type recombinase/integrase [Acidiphilium sp.]
MKMTHRTIEAIACPAGKKDVLVFDDELPGFGLRVSANGGKVFLVQYRTPAGPRRLALGKFGVLTLDQGRRRAREILGDVAGGGDPVAERRKAAEAAAKKDKDGQFTVERLIADWAAARADVRRGSYISVAVGSLRKHLAGLLDRPAASITPQEAVAVLDDVKVKAGPVAANRALAYGRACYGWAVKRHRLGVNPFCGLEAPAGETSRDRVLSDTEIGAIWRAASAAPYPFGPFIRTLLLTAARRDEVAAMRWSEISADGCTWGLPALRAKNNRAHVVHLSEPLRQLFASLPRLEGQDLIFSTTGSTSISGFSRFKAAFDIKVAAEHGTPLAHWTLHDFRRAIVTWGADAGFAPHVADRLLNHVTGSISGVAAVYQRAEFQAERRALLDAWGAHVIAVAEGRALAANVVSLRG